MLDGFNELEPPSEVLLFRPEVLLLNPEVLLFSPVEGLVEFVAPFKVDVPEFVDVFDLCELVGDVPFIISDSVQALRATTLTVARGSASNFHACNAGTGVGSGSEFGLAGSGSGKGAGSGVGAGMGSG